MSVIKTAARHKPRIEQASRFGIVIALEEAAVHIASGFETGVIKDNSRRSGIRAWAALVQTIADMGFQNTANEIVTESLAISSVLENAGQKIRRSLNLKAELSAGPPPKLKLSEPT